MSKTPGRKGPTRLGALVGKAIAPLAARRGFATADLISAWDSVVGDRYAGHSQPERLVWPRNGDGPGVLTIRVDGARAVLLQHELPQFIERINAFLGFAAVGEVRLIQRPVGRTGRAAAPPLPATLPAPAEAALAEAVDGIEDGALRDALLRLGREIAREGLAEA